MGGIGWRSFSDRQPTAHAITVMVAFQAAGSDSSLRSIACVDADIVIGEVGRPHMCLGMALPQVNGDRKLLSLEDLGNLPFSGKSYANALFDHDDVVEMHSHFLGIDRDARPADRTHDTSPIGVFSKQCGFYEIGRGDRRGDSLRG